MRAAAWATNRDIAAARLSWERAQRIADALPAEYPNRAALRIAPRTMLCAIAYRVHMNVAGARFDELRQLCTATGDQVSLAIGMAGLVMDHAMQARLREASQLASEAWALVESIGDPSLTVGMSFALLYARAENGEWSDVLRWSQRVIDLADGDPSKGNFMFGSPLAFAFDDAGYGPVLAGSSRMARRPTARPGHGPQRRPDVLRHGRRLGLYRGDSEWRAQARRSPRCARSRMPYGLPNDPVMTSRWPTPG